MIQLFFLIKQKLKPLATQYAYSKEGESNLSNSREINSFFRKLNRKTKLSREHIRSSAYNVVETNIDKRDNN
jgi:hypothetical protein